MSSCRNRRGQFTQCRVGGAARGRGRRVVDSWLLKEGRDYVETVKGVPIYHDWEFKQYIIAIDPSDSGTWDYATTKRRARTLARKAGSSRAPKGHAARYTTSEIPAAWARGEVASAGALTTDGKTLYSYQLPIGVTKRGKKIAYRYQSPDHFQSMTTSKHVGYALRYADEIKNPPRRK